MDKHKNPPRPPYLVRNVVCEIRKSLVFTQMARHHSLVGLGFLVSKETARKNLLSVLSHTWYGHLAFQNEIYSFLSNRLPNASPLLNYKERVHRGGSLLPLGLLKLIRAIDAMFP